MLFDDASKGFDSTNSITCAKTVLPTFMRPSGSSNPERHRKWAVRNSIVDTQKSPESLVGKEVESELPDLNRTVLETQAF